MVLNKDLNLSSLNLSSLTLSSLNRPDQTGNHRRMKDYQLLVELMVLFLSFQVLLWYIRYSCSYHRNMDIHPYKDPYMGKTKVK